MYFCTFQFSILKRNIHTLWIMLVLLFQFVWVSSSLSYQAHFDTCIPWWILYFSVLFAPGHFSYCFDGLTKGNYFFDDDKLHTFLFIIMCVSYVYDKIEVICIVLVLIYSIIWQIRLLYLQVIWLEQQVAKKRVKRFVSYQKFDDEKWISQWYLVSEYISLITKNNMCL